MIFFHESILDFSPKSRVARLANKLSQILLSVVKGKRESPASLIAAIRTELRQEEDKLAKKENDT